MGSPQNSPASPSLSRSSSGRRPNTLALGASTKSPSNTPTKSPAKSPGSPATSIKARSTPQRTGSLGKGSKVTRPVGPNLSTEARSLTRPCGCGKPGHGGNRNGHKDGHGTGHHAHEPAPHSQHASPTIERKERPKKTVRSPSIKAKSPPAQTPPPPAQTPPPPSPPQIEEAEDMSNNMNEEDDNSSNMISNTDDDASNQNVIDYTQLMADRYISTLVWVPQMMTEKYSTKDAPKFTDTVFIKPRYRELHHEERLLSSGGTCIYNVQQQVC